jgi:hypothetical protein
MCGRGMRARIIFHMASPWGGSRVVHPRNRALSFTALRANQGIQLEKSCRKLKLSLK